MGRHGSRRYSQELPRHTNDMHDLPVEIAEHIISYIHSHKDLLSLALVSRAFPSLIIPKHIEYRELRIGPTTPHIWTHLAHRADLTCNIRTVVFQTPASGRLSRYPVTLVDDGHAVDVSEDNLVDVICKAFRNMRRLENFCWRNSSYKSSTRSDVKILTSLSHCRSLTHVDLVGDFGYDNDTTATQDMVVRVVNYALGE